MIRPLFFVPRSDDIRNILFFIFFVIVQFLCQILQCHRENREHLKYFKNAYCVTTNHSKDQGTPTSYKTTKTNKYSCLQFSFSRPIGFYLATQQHSRNISGVHGFPSLIVKISR